MKTMYSLLLAVFTSMISHAQTITVLDRQDLAPIEGVYIQNNNSSIFTNTLGQAEIKGLTGNFIIKMSGYLTVTLSAEQLENQEYIVYLKSDPLSLDQIVVSATRWEQKERDIPQHITTISSKDISLGNPQTAADMLGQSNAVFIQKSQQGGGSPMIRGFATNRILIAVDGVRMNNAIFRSGNLQNVINIDPFAIRSAEVLFGPGSVMYGSDAIGGVMSFQTLVPELSTSNSPLIRGNAITRYSSANQENTGHFDIQVGWKKWAIASSFSQNNYGDLRMGTYGPEEYLRNSYVQRIDSVDRVFTNDDAQIQKNSGFNQTNLMQKIRFQPNEHWNFEYGFHYSTTTNYDRYDRLLRMRNGLPRSAEWKYGPQVWIMNNLAIQHRNSTLLFDEMNVRLAQQHFEESRHDRDFNKVIRSNRFEEVEAYSINLDFKKVVSPKGILNYGLEYVYNDVTSSGTDEDISTGLIVEGPARYPKSNWSSQAVYADYEYKANEKWVYAAGVRYNQYQLHAVFDDTFYPFPFKTADINDGALTGNLGIVYHPSPTSAIRLNGSTGFRSPNIDDVGKVFDSEPGSVVVPNPDLTAEYAYNAELGFAKVFAGRVKVDLAVYYTYLQDALVRRDFQLNGMDSILYNGTLSQVQAIQNAASAYVYGIQAGLDIDLTRGFVWSSKFNFQKGKEELDNGDFSPLRHAGPYFGSSFMNYSADKLKLQFGIRFNGEVSYNQLAEEERGKEYIYAIDRNGNPYSPAWYVLDFKAQMQVNRNWSITGGIENITDQRYRPYSSGLVAPGRNFILSAKLTW